MNGSSSVQISLFFQELVSVVQHSFMSYLIWSGQYFLFFLSTKFEKTTVKQGPQITWYLWFVYLLIDCSFENVISSSDYTALDGRMINELEVVWRKWPWPNETLPQYLFGDTEENHF